MADMCRDIMALTPSKLDICVHGKERQDCEKCRKPMAADIWTQALRRIDGEANDRLEKLHAQSEK